MRDPLVKHLPAHHRIYCIIMVVKKVSQKYFSRDRHNCPNMYVKLVFKLGIISFNTSLKNSILQNFNLSLSVYRRRYFVSISNRFINH